MTLGKEKRQAVGGYWELLHRNWQQLLNQRHNQIKTILRNEVILVILDSLNIALQTLEPLFAEQLENKESPHTVQHDLHNQLYTKMLERFSTARTDQADLYQLVQQTCTGRTISTTPPFPTPLPRWFLSDYLNRDTQRLTVDWTTMVTCILNTLLTLTLLLTMFIRRCRRITRNSKNKLHAALFAIAQASLAEALFRLITQDLHSRFP